MVAIVFTSALNPAVECSQRNVILQQELVRYGLVHYNLEYFTQPTLFWEWFSLAQEEVRAVPFSSRADCYQGLVDHFRKKN